ncbi:hypothetical protein [Saccharopolyspora pogona]|uniref:hypothetical protein n=1 Tax=Saccharopolyspora pogona TaxID=333966 RepID=UPI001686C376|nr:hypothetical protein [Saccharopolyspora pogona]
MSAMAERGVTSTAFGVSWTTDGRGESATIRPSAHFYQVRDRALRYRAVASSRNRHRDA